jgi:dihydrofolate reductase
MRKLVVTEFMSLDGVVENPGWTFPYWNDEIAAFKGEETSTSDALLLGRVTYEGFAQAGPNSTDEGAPYFNGVRKYVASSTLDKAEWNNSQIIRGNLVEEVRALKQQAGTNITVHGSANLVQSLAQHDLVDVYRILVYPVVLGAGQRMFDAGTTLKLKLLESRALSGGVVALIYEPDRS